MSVGTGIRCFTQGLSDAGAKDARPYIAGPALISLLIISTGLYFGFGYIDNLSLAMQNALPVWLDFLHVVLAPLIYVLGILVGAWLFGLLATIIGSPFLGDLAQHTAEQLEGPDLTLPQIPWWQEIVPSLMREGRKLLYHLPRLAFLLIASFIPLLNAIAPALWLLFGAWMMAVQFCDYDSEIRRQPFQATLSQLRQNRAAALGFGACVTLCMSIPLLNFLVAPVAVIGGTILMHTSRTQDSVA
ncbi:MAG: sulfate transporter CysZ [Pseudomonadota bacterium]